ncbi:MAG: glycosyltransferase family 4 protein [Thermoanaerobaculia bacterium]
MESTPASSPPRLIHAWPYVEWGGVQIYFLNLLRTAAEEFDVRAILPEGSSPTLLGYLSDQSVAIEQLPARCPSVAARGLAARVGLRYRKLRAESVFRRHLLAAAGGSAILHVDVAPWTSHRLLAALARRHPTVVTLHTRLPEPGRFRRRLWRRRLRRLARTPGFRLIATNLDVRDSLVPHLGTWVEANVPIAYSGVDLREIAAVESAPADRDERLRELGLPTDRTLVVVAAQFIERKGNWTFLEAAAHLETRCPRLFFVWLGMEDLPPETEVRIASIVGPDAFRYLPSRLSGTSRLAFLSTLAALADIFVLPSLVEGLPLVLIEAMALGKPIVATRINGIPEAIEDGSNGLLVPPGRAAELAAAIASLADHPETARRLGDAARRTAAERFDQRSTTEVTMQAYRAALRSPASSGPPGREGPGGGR